MRGRAWEFCGQVLLAASTHGRHLVSVVTAGAYFMGLCLEHPCAAGVAGGAPDLESWFP